MVGRVKSQNMNTRLGFLFHRNYNKYRGNKFEKYQRRPAEMPALILKGPASKPPCTPINGLELTFSESGKFSAGSTSTQGSESSVSRGSYQYSRKKSLN